jgi:hypothetical protein
VLVSLVRGPANRYLAAEPPAETGWRAMLLVPPAALRRLGHPLDWKAPLLLRLAADVELPQDRAAPPRPRPRAVR